MAEAGSLESWPDVWDRLSAEFPDVAPRDVLATLLDARHDVERLGPADEDAYRRAQRMAGAALRATALAHRSCQKERVL